MSLEIQSALRTAGLGVAVVTLVAACSSNAGASSSQGVAGATASAAMSEQPMMSPSAAAKMSMASGSFHRVDGQATGTVALFHLPDGSFQVTFEDFNTATTQDIHVVLVKNADIMSSSEVDKSALLDLGPLKGTTGMQDYAVPASMAGSIGSYHTVVLWDTAMAHAIAAAPLK